VFLLCVVSRFLFFLSACLSFFTSRLFFSPSSPSLPPFLSSPLLPLSSSFRSDTNA
jgi:hypothetical protein